MTKLNQLISFVIITDKPEGVGCLNSFPSYNVYYCNIGELSKADRTYTKYEKNAKCLRATSHKDIKTPWVMLLEEDEFLHQEEIEKLFEYIKKENVNCAFVNVERFLPHEKLQKYAWVKTRVLFDYPPDGIKRYFTSELRLLPTGDLCRTDILILSDKGPAGGSSFLVNANEQDRLFTDINISRKSEIRTAKKAKAPADHDVFRYSHQRYYDDGIYCPSFEWPHTTYNTIRFDYIPSVIQALDEGLSTPDIVAFTLTYLFRFRDFGTASEIIKRTPEKWLEQHPELMVAVGTIYLANEEHDKALTTFTQAYKLFPNIDMVVTNAIKVHIILGLYDMIEPIENEYKIATGHQLDDDFISHFKKVHIRLPRENVSVSLCMIIKNEEKYLERALQSAKDIVNEIIIVDTGSTDNSVSIAEKFGAKVFHMPWTDDFSAARNHAIEKAAGDYIFMLDADEYISPYYYIESQTLMKLLSLDSPRAFKFSIGHYFTPTDWLFILQSAGNFRLESTSIRLFPKILGVQYKGLTEETIEDDLVEREIPINLIPADSFHILHDSDNYSERIMRKCHIRNKEKSPNSAQILAAVKDFSFIGDRDETLKWLRKYHSECRIDDPVNLRMALAIAKFLEPIVPEEAESYYNQILIHYPMEHKVLMNYAYFLIKENQINKLQKLPFRALDEYRDLEGNDKLDFSCLTSLKYFESGNIEKAFNALETVLQESIACLFAQSLKFYYLIRMNHIEDAIETLNDLYQILATAKHFSIESMADLVGIVEDLSEILLKKGYYHERAILIHGALSLENLWLAT